MRGYCIIVLQYIMLRCIICQSLSFKFKSDPQGPQEAETAGRFLPERLGKTVVLLAHGLCNDGALAGGELEVDHKFVKHSEKALRYALGEGERVRGWRQILDDNTVRADAEAKAGGL